MNLKKQALELSLNECVKEGRQRWRDTERKRKRVRERKREREREREG